MTEIIRERDFSKIGLFQSVLESEGIATYVRNKNESLAIDLAGSPPKYWPALCVVKDDDVSQAVEILKERFGANEKLNKPEWVCEKCSESNPGNFDICWSCNEPHSG